MTDVVVTLPKSFGLAAWIEEGDAAGEARNKGVFYYWKVGRRAPDIEAGERVYVAYKGRLIGYAPLVALWRDEKGTCYLVRGGCAKAVTIPLRIDGFRGYRYRWWDREQERPFPEWKELAA